MAQKIDAGNIGTLASATTILSTFFGLVFSYATYKSSYSTIDAGLSVSIFWLFFHTPVILSAQDRLRREFGGRSPITIIGNSFSGRRSKRKIPFSADGKDSHILMSSIPFLRTEIKEPELDSFTVRVDSIDYTVTLIEMEKFIRTAWNRQRAGKLGLSRTYWTKRSRPRLKTLEYNARIHILLSVPGLILDRSQGRSGYLANRPLPTIKTLVNLFPA